MRTPHHFRTALPSMPCTASTHPCRRQHSPHCTMCTSPSRWRCTAPPHNSHTLSPTMSPGRPCLARMACTSSHPQAHRRQHHISGMASLDWNRGRTCLPRTLCSCPDQCLSTCLQHIDCCSRRRVWTDCGVNVGDEWVCWCVVLRVGAGVMLVWILVLMFCLGRCICIP